MWQHVSIFVVPNEQAKKNIQDAAMEKIQNERKDVKKKKQPRESNSCHLLAGSTSSKLKYQVGHQGDLNFMCKKLQITTHL